ncbi:right-handed parallel beta-helix repeat-containing protein [Vibrio misgurnus]|uniref:right-handed parallel beta-helix repeat-containing protein n=1 Tax=Vibrio misgurnus TaxID=2993714 RepID=UPI0023F7D87B|nr:right-handed parallel beta-helix repeat-containing protein [Vibrio sp. VCS]
MSTPTLDTLVDRIDALEASTAELVDLYAKALLGIDSGSHVLSANVNAKARQVAEQTQTTIAQTQRALQAAQTATLEASKAIQSADRAEQALHTHVWQVTHLKALPTEGLDAGMQCSVARFYAHQAGGGATYVYDAQRAHADHDGAQVIALPALSAWDGLPTSVASFLSWSGSGQGAYVLIGHQALYASQFVADPSDALSVSEGLHRLNQHVTDGTLIYLDIPMVAPSSALVISNNNVKVMGGTFTRNPQSTEYPIWIGKPDTLVNGVVLIGLTIIGEKGSDPLWGKQGVYVRRATNTTLIGCQFKKIGDAAIRLAANVSSPSVEGALESRTDGVQLIGCVFEDCQQITTNNTGAHSLLFSGCVFRRLYSVKLTQRNLVKGKITLFIGCLFDEVQRVLEIQGGGNVEMIHCTGSAQMLVSGYANENTLIEGSVIPYGNITLTQCRFVLACPDGNACYFQAFDSANHQPALNYGAITFNQCHLTSLNPAARFIRMFASTAVIASSHPDLFVDGCQFRGFLGDALVSVVNLVVYPWSVKILNCQWDEVNQVLLGEFRGSGDWSVEICGNQGKVRLSVHVIARNTYGQVLRVNRNHFLCSTNDGVGYAFVDMNFFALSMECLDNRFDMSQCWRSVGSSLAQPKVEGCNLTLGGNQWYLPSASAVGTLPRPFYISSATGIGWVGVLKCYDNVIFGEGRKARAEAASGLSLGALELNYRWVGKEAERRLLKSSYAENISSLAGSWRLTEIYSDGYVCIKGRSQNSAANSFNLYFPHSTAQTSQPMTPMFTPEEPCFPYIVTRLNNGLVVRFSNAAGLDISPWFLYRVEYQITLNEVANVLGGI